MLRDLLKITAAGVAAAGALAGAADARPYETLRYHETYAFLAERCDVTVRVRSDEQGTIVGRPAGKQRLARYTLTWRGESTWTNVATGLGVSFRWQTSLQDLSVADNHDGTLTLLGQHAGSERIYGPDGRRLAISAGMFRERVLLDHGGTPADPSDDTFLGSEIVSHTGGLLDEDLCPVFRELTGSAAS